MAIKEMKINYLCDSWQYMIQQIHFLVNRGYFYYHVIELPVRKKEKWIAIDEKLIAKYEMNVSKYTRSRNKKNGLANFYYLRCESVGIILHTKGNIEFAIDDKFFDIHKRPILIPISQNIELEIALKVDKDEKDNKSKKKKKDNKDKKKSYTVSFSQNCYNAIKIHLEEVIKTKNKYKICFEFNMLNGIPAYGGINDQKVELAKWVVKCCQYHQVKLEYKDLRVNTFRKMYRKNDDTNDEEPG